MTGTMTRTATKRTRTRATKLTKSSWSPEFIKQAAEDAAEPSAEIAMETIEVEEMVRQEEPVPTFSDAGDARVLDSHGPDAARIASCETDPKLVEAREWLANLIANPPRGSIVVDVDYFRARAALERNLDNRKLSERLVRELQGILDRDEWEENGQSAGFSTCGKMLNGQHRFTAIMRSGKTVVMDLRFGLNAKSFRTMDRGKSRTNADDLGIMGHANTNTLAAAARLMLRYEMKSSMATLERASSAQITDVVQRHRALAEGTTVGSRLRASRASGIRSASVAAFVWALAVEYDRDTAEKFFKKWETGLDIKDSSDVVWKLRKRLGSKSREKSEVIAALSIKAFNSFATKTPLGVLKWTDSDKRGAEDFPLIVSKQTDVK